jgi:hypothetical protein
MDLSDPRLYDQASPEDRLLFLRSQLTAIRASMVQARDRGDTAALSSLLALYQQLGQRAVELTAVVNDAGQPSSFMRALSDFSDEMVSAGAAVGGAFLETAQITKSLIDDTLRGLDTGIQAAGQTLGLLPWLLIAAAIVLVIVFIRASGISAGPAGVSVRR